MAFLLSVLVWCSFRASLDDEDFRGLKTFNKRPNLLLLLLCLDERVSVRPPFLAEIEGDGGVDDKNVICSWISI